MEAPPWATLNPNPTPNLDLSNVGGASHACPLLDPRLNPNVTRTPRRRRGIAWRLVPGQFDRPQSQRQGVRGGVRPERK